MSIHNIDKILPSVTNKQLTRYILYKEEEKNNKE